jgi:hypothetical protein
VRKTAARQATLVSRKHLTNATMTEYALSVHAKALASHPTGTADVFGRAVFAISRAAVAGFCIRRSFVAIQPKVFRSRSIPVRQVSARWQ